MSKNTIYVVDDDKNVLHALEWFFNSMNFEVKSFNNARDFLQQYNSQYQGCLITDVRMPGMDGFELLNKLNALNSRLKVIFITAFGDIPMAIKAIKGGAVDFVTKPIDQNNLLDLIKKCLKHYPNDTTIDTEHLLTEQELQALELLWKEG